MFIQTSNGLSQINFNKILAKITFYTKDLHFSVDPSLVAQKTIERLADLMTTKQIDELSAGLSANLVNIHPDYSILGARILMDRMHKDLQIPYKFGQAKSEHKVENSLENSLENTEKYNTNLDKSETLTFCEHLEKMYNYKINGRKSSRISDSVMNFARKNQKELEQIIDYSKDFDEYSYTALTSWIKRGLEKMDGKTCETPSQMFLRVAIGVNVWQEKDETDLLEFTKFAGFQPEFKIIKNMTNSERLEKIKEYYDLLVSRKISVSGPVLMHAGSSKNQMASCFLEDCEDSLTGDDYPITGKIGGIMKSLSQLAKQSQGGAGTAVAFHKIRANGSIIASSNGISNGILPFMKMFDSTIGAVNQSGKRSGVCTIYLETWHADILDFLDSANHFTIEEKRCKNLFFALWGCDLFFRRFATNRQNAKWTLFDPAKIKPYLEKPLSEYYGQEFAEKYQMLENLGLGKTISLMEIWSRICNLFQTTGQPYILNKDEFNRKSNSKNIGIIKSSNVCTEIALPASDDETAVCVLSSVCVSRFLDKSQTDGVDYDGIILAAQIATKNLNNIIDLQFYPTPETRNACLARRAIGLSVQGLADLFLQLNLEFTSQKARLINKKVYECLYYGSLLESMEIAKIEGSYLGFEGSPASNGILQYDMWDLQEFIGENNQENKPNLVTNQNIQTNGFNKNQQDSQNQIWENHLFLGQKWLELKEDIKKFGLRHSEVTALAPTVSSAIRMDNNDGFEPFSRNIFIRQSIAGSMQVINKYLVNDLIKLGVWSTDLFDQIVWNDGSVQNIDQIPQNIQKKYQTVFEIDWKDLVDMQVDRSPFVSQSSSFNHYTNYKDASPTTFTQKILYSWRKKLKTLSYYMHTETATTAKKEFGMTTKKTQDLPNSKENEQKIGQLEQLEQSCDMTEGCEACGV
jgi:ribonucleoside-diphosphate reductase alpha chain